MQKANTVHMQSPDGDETREVEGIAAILTPLMVAGWRQVPAPAAPTAHKEAQEEK